MKSEIKIQNFRILEDITIDLRPTTFLLGPNGSGKSTLIKALFFLARNLNKDTSDYKPSYDFPDNNIILKSFKNIIIKGDTEKKITFEFEYENKFSSLKKIPVYCLENIAPLTPDEKEEEYSINRCDNSDEQNKIRKNVYQLSESYSYKSLLEFFNQANVAELLKVFSEVNNDFNLKFSFEFGKNTLEKMLKFSFSDFDIVVNDNKESRQSYLYGKLEDDELWDSYYKVNPRVDEYYIFEKKLYDKLIEELKGQLRFNENKLTFNEIAIKVKDFLVELNTNLDNEILSEEEREIFFKGILFLYQIKILFREIFINNLIQYNFSGIRELPKYSYPLINSEFGKSEYYSLLNVIPTKKESNDYLNDPENMHNLLSKSNINLESLNYILKMLNFGKMIYTIKLEDHGKIKLLTFDNEEIDLVNCSSGLLQTFPIIFELLSFYTYPQEYTPRISIEQPELHLHPKLQTKFMEFLIGENLIIETHSEHIIKKIQVMFAQEKISDKDIAVNYFDRDDEGRIKIKKMEIDKYGLFKEKWPDGFFDESIELTFSLLDSIRARSN